MDIQKLVPLNYEIMKNPGNWVTIFLMIAFAGLAAEVVLQYLNQNKINI